MRASNLSSKAMVALMVEIGVKSGLRLNLCLDVSGWLKAEDKPLL